VLADTPTNEDLLNARRDGDKLAVAVASNRPMIEDPAPLRAVHTPNFPALLRQLGAALVVTTYQADKLVVVRDQEFNRP
jgi:hypothetical protein